MLHYSLADVTRFVVTLNNNPVGAAYLLALMLVWRVTTRRARDRRSKRAKDAPMLLEQTSPLALAARVLQPATLRAVHGRPFNLRGWAVLDRWAVNTPGSLRALEAQGLDVLRARLLAQQVRELEVLEAYAETFGTATPDHEVLNLAGVETELNA